MAKFICIKECQYLGRVYKVNDIVTDFSTTPPTDFFSSFTGERYQDLPGGFGTDTDGTLYMRGEGWDDLRFPAVGINPPGAASDPARNTSDGLLEFSASQTNVIVGVAQMPHSWKLGSRVEPHIHWLAADANAGNVYWRFEYKVASINGDFQADYTVANTLSAAPGSAVKHAIHGLADMDMTGYGISAMIQWKLSRIGGDATDTYAGVARLLEVDFHYISDSFGSGQYRSK